MTSIDTQQQRKLATALDHLHTATENLDEVFSMQTKLALAMLRRAITVSTEVTPRTVSDMQFALNDLTLVSEELPPGDRESFDPQLQAIDDVILHLRAAAMLPKPLVNRLSILRTKMAERRTAIERETYRPPEKEPTPIPHDPEALRGEADDIRLELKKAGYDTPALDRLAESPGSFRFHDVSDLIDELDVIIG
jgi:hypothetical protein